MRSLLKKVFGSAQDKNVTKLYPVIEDINDLEPQMLEASDEEFEQFRLVYSAHYKAGESLDDLLPEVFASVREAARRALGQRHFDVQLMGGIVLHQGKIAEMRTGEGKTLTATSAVALNALSGEGVHVITVNDYLARRDTQWMGRVYNRLGLSIGCIQHDEAFLFDPEWESPDSRLEFLRPVERREAYAADITYGTNNEFGFDYLRDNMVVSAQQQVQRGLNYAIVDEVDNILIDEARTPLIISGQAERATDKYYQFAQIVRQLREDKHYEVDLKHKTATLTEEGVDRVEQLAGIPEGESIYDDRYIDLTHYLEQALKAEAIFHRDKDYMVRDGEVIIVDEFTGRMMIGRRYSEGLHQAIEAKEGVRVQRQNVTMATITFQNYFRMYKKLGGMTGTAYTEREELGKIYNIVGKDAKAVDEVKAGDIVALAKLKATLSGQTLCDEKHGFAFTPPELPPALFSRGVKFEGKGAEEKVSTALYKLTEEDPGLSVAIEETTRELVVSGLGSLHLEITVERIRRRIGIDCRLGAPHIAYKETITKKVTGVEGKHKKQSGGHGQFGVCYIDMEPTARNAGFVFEDAIVGGSIPRQFIPSVEKGIVKTMARGFLAGFPIVDFKVRVYDGKYHDVDSSDAAFQLAGSKAFKAAIAQAGPVLLEPIVKLNVIVPSVATGDVIGDINSRRGRILGTDSIDDQTIVNAYVPLSEILEYESKLKSMTQGKGTFSMAVDHLAICPPMVQEKVIKDSGFKAVEEED